MRHDTLDATLAAADAHLSGVEPTLWLERLNRPPVIEWLSFFYFNYYTLQLAFVIGVLYVEGPGPSADEFGFETALLYTVGQLSYMVVPDLDPNVH